MKMSAEHFARLESAIKRVCGYDDKFAQVYAKNNPTFSPKRVRWDLCWAAKFHYEPRLFSEIYAAGLNDDHIDTALRRIVKL